MTTGLQEMEKQTSLGVENAKVGHQHRGKTNWMGYFSYKEKKKEIRSIISGRRGVTETSRAVSILFHAADM